MSTKDIHENHEPAPPLGLGSSEGLGGPACQECAVQPCKNCPDAAADNSHADIDAVYAMTAQAMACGLLTEVVTAYGDHRASGESAERAAAMALWDWDA